MSFYFRKSKNLSKNTKLNFSKSGAGISTGIKGARIGINAKGQVYTHIGRKGVYYKKNLFNLRTLLNVVRKFISTFK